MNIGWATFALAEQTPIHIADAGAARSAPPSIPMKKGFDIQLPYDGQRGVVPGVPGEQRRNRDDGTSQKPSEMGASPFVRRPLEPPSQHPERQTNDVAKWLAEAAALLLAVAQFPRGLENRRRVCRSVVRRRPPTMARSHLASVELLLDLGSASLPP